MKKIIYLICLCLAVVMVLVSCGGNTDNNTDDSGAATESEGSATSAEDTAEEENDPYTLGLQYKAQGDLENALDCFNTAKEEDPADYHSYMELADIYIRQGEFVSAYDILNEGFAVTNYDGFNRKLIEFNSANVICDSDGLPRGKTHFEGFDLVWCHKYVTDSETGMRSCVIYYNSDGEEISRADITYSPEGKPLTGYAYYTHTGEIEKTLYEYNGDGQLAKTHEYTADGVLIGYSINGFDADGYKVKETYYNADGSEHWSLEYTHNVDARESKCITYFYGKQVGETDSAYSEFGYSSSSSSRFKGDYDRTIEYTFDYESNHQRVEGFESDVFYSRIVCYGAELSLIY